ncbi:Acetyltransferase (GNAT) domain-containing protein [Madurella fahalii]|uniref:Acetyltransferase (GNAT) domain-containing protein n=1 Tax=Madurella fahalii TaxID=1157608 RepID=A0ABQ0G3V0_9PEZI
MTSGATPASTQPSHPPLQQPALPKSYTLRSGYPSIPDYLRLRAVSGLSPKTAAQAAPVASGSWYGCYVTFTGADAETDKTTTSSTSSTPTTDGTTTAAVAVRGSEETVAMGRVIGDGGWYFHIADMAVVPAHQRKGLGEAVLKHLVAHIRANAPPRPYITLLADEPGRRLYARNGFVETMPGSLGMMLPMEGGAD